ncbi:MAG: transglycosylase SLT domain-containing protein [Steroidobacteraceae bacterium]
MINRWNARRAALMLLLAAGQAARAETPGAGSAPDSVRQEFVAAMQIVNQHLPEAPDSPDSPALEAYVIHDYLVAARLRRDLASAPGEDLDRTIEAFLRAHAGEPVTRALRHDWLASLADRHRWDWFLPRSADAADPQIACDRLAGRLATGDTSGLAEDALVRWSMPQKQPGECDAVFAWLRSKELLTAALAESRTRAALSADNPRLAREFVAEVPEPRSGALLQWIQLLDAPKAAIALLSLNPEMPVEPEALAAGFNRLCFSDFEAASALLPALLKRPDLTPVQRIRLQRAAALGAAYSRAPGSVAAFADLPTDATDSQVLEWRLRAALWAGDFATALTWINDLPPSLASQPRWRYWHARAVAVVGGAAAAVPLFSDIAGMRDYYGYLAADRLQQSYNLNVHPSPDDADAQAALAADAGLQRAHALFDCGMTDDAGAEWAAVLGAAKPALKVQAAHLASRWGWYAQTIATLAQAQEWDDVPLRYPRPYAAIVADAGKQAQVPADWIFAIMRQESLFRKDAVSRADARGLMQMQPPTATAVARRWHLAPPTRMSLFDPTVAVPLGALYVRELLDKYNGQLDQTLAAYNAGPMSVARWLPGNPIDADVWIENIPYAETRGYVQHILEHIVAFAAMRDATPPRLAALLPKVEPVQPLVP